MPDQTILCTDCGASFVFTEAEQSFFEARRLLAPKRCKACRISRKHGRSSGVRTLKLPPTAFAPDEERSGTISAPPPPRTPRATFEIRCVECGTTAFVPFRPVEGRPVYCQGCYADRKGSVRQATDGVVLDESDEGIIE
jgi:CxxC-x17-CxxC domain-containing protein